MGKLHNEMRRQALMAVQGAGKDRLGTVTSYDQSAYAIKVMIQPEGFETGWLPLKSQWVGNGWGLFTPPPLGAQVEVTFQEGHPEAGLSGEGVFSDEDRPLPVPAGEAWLVHKSGAFIKLTNTPALTLGDGQGALITLADGTISSSGAWIHTGSFQASQTITSDVGLVVDGVAVVVP